MIVSMNEELLITECAQITSYRRLPPGQLGKHGVYSLLKPDDAAPRVTDSDPPRNLQGMQRAIKTGSPAQIKQFSSRKISI